MNQEGRRPRTVRRRGTNSSRSTPAPFLVAARFLALWLLGTALLALLPGLDRLAVRWTTASASRTLDFVSIAHVSSESGLLLAGEDIRIIPDCTPTQSLMLLCAGLLAYPAAWGARMVGALVGGALLTVLNLLRLILLLLIESIYPRAFEFCHVYLWQLITFGAVCAILVLWRRWQIGSFRHAL